MMDRDRLATFIYLLLREELPVRRIETTIMIAREIVRDVPSSHAYLLNYASKLADELMR